MQTILAIDLGPERSAFCYLIDGKIGVHDWVDNEVLLSDLCACDPDAVVLESPQAQNRPLGKLLRDTIIMAGRVIEICYRRKLKLIEADERDVALWLTGNRSAGNPSVLQSLKDIFGEGRERVCNACNGTGVQPGVRKATTKKCVGCRGRSLVKEPGPLPTNEHVRSALGAAWWFWKRTQERRDTA